jgi:hypothetical protein
MRNDSNDSPFEDQWAPICPARVVLADFSGLMMSNDWDLMMAVMNHRRKKIVAMCIQPANPRRDETRDG